MTRTQQFFDERNDLELECSRLRHENRTLKLEVQNLKKRLEMILEKTNQQTPEQCADGINNQ